MQLFSTATTTTSSIFLDQAVRHWAFFRVLLFCFPFLPLRLFQLIFRVSDASVVQTMPDGFIFSDIFFSLPEKKLFANWRLSRRSLRRVSSSTRKSCQASQQPVGGCSLSPSSLKTIFGGESVRVHPGNVIRVSLERLQTQIKIFVSNLKAGAVYSPAHFSILLKI